MYFALGGSYFADAALEISLQTAPSTPETALALLRGDADISWGGPMRVLLHHDQDGDCPLICFGSVVSRDPFLLLGRHPKPGFRFSDLVGLSVSIASDVPTPWMMFQDDVARQGVDPNSLVRHDDLPMSKAVEAFVNGEFDVIQVFEPYADFLIEQAGAKIWHRFSDRGDIAYTTFYATRQFIAENPDTCRRLMAAMERAVADFLIASVDEIAERLQAFFPHFDRASLARMVERYRSAGLWSARQAITPTALVRLKAALLSGGLLRRDTPYDRIVDTTLVNP